ncbi:hypothetical protein D0863_05525 [Hortaea werneckii]|uniref:Heterokaryon incompatibility domain-containing protein n=1 Tax=Hortaea werneckii TaxID=91943 RepID=A0A3M7E329_HORWE|nr:hypothetical protein D0863_05525 [Hortaea werneckii]
MKRIWKPLDKEKREIRIILLQPSEEENDALYADLEIASLDNSPEYKAISYVWGDASDTTAMFVNGGKVIQITKNLAAALRRFREDRVVVPLWADAVCINQADFRERADQVSMMAEIYATAIEVNAWLGEDIIDPRLRDILHLLVEECRLPQHVKCILEHGCAIEYALSHVVQDWDIRSSAPEHIQSWCVCMILLSCCTWFSRLWVIQEVAFARSAKLFSGQFSCTIEALNSKILEFLTLPMEKLRPVSLIMAFLSARKQLHPFIWARRETVVEDVVERMLDCKDLQCEDDRDKIYGLLGLTTLSGELSIDYNKTVEQVFIDFAFACIEKSSLNEILLCSGLATKNRMLPSWVPDWKGDTREKVDFYREVSKSHDPGAVVLNKELSQPRHRHEASKLRLRAFLVDRLCALSPSLGDIGKNTLQGNLGEQCFETLREWRWFLRDFHKSFWQIVCWGCNEVNDNFSETIEQKWSSAFEAITADPNKLRFCEDYRLLDGCLFKAQPLLTVSGLPGSTSIGAQTGDLVTLIPGCRLPFLIRRQDDSKEELTFRLIGPCYIDGIMGDDAMRFMFKAYWANANTKEVKAMHDDINAALVKLREITDNGDIDSIINEPFRRLFGKLSEEIVLV